MKPFNTVAGVVGSRLLGRPLHARCRRNHRCGMRNVHTRAGAFPELASDRIAVVAERLRALGARDAVIDALVALRLGGWGLTGPGR